MDGNPGTKHSRLSGALDITTGEDGARRTKDRVKRRTTLTSCDVSPAPRSTHQHGRSSALFDYRRRGEACASAARRAESDQAEEPPRASHLHRRDRQHRRGARPPRATYRRASGRATARSVKRSARRRDAATNAGGAGRPCVPTKITCGRRHRASVRRAKGAQHARRRPQFGGLLGAVVASTVVLTNLSNAARGRAIPTRATPWRQ